MNFLIQFLLINFLFSFSFQNDFYWNQSQILIANDGESNEYFGSSVSISNDKKYCVISSPLSQIGNSYYQGKAYIFENNGMNWNQKQILIASDGETLDEFGSSVSISNNFVVIGASHAKVEESFQQGKAYIFENNGTNWNQKQILISDDGRADDRFGSSISISNDSSFIVIGAFYARIGNNSQQGKAYIFQNNGTFWNLSQILIANDGETNDYFALSVSISEKYCLIGSPQTNVGENAIQGKVYIFQNNGTFWNQYQILIANDGLAYEKFGFSVSISGNYSLIGAPWGNVENNYRQGKAYIFQNNGTNWNQKQILIANDGEENDYFASSVSISENYCLIGSPQKMIANKMDQGKAYIFQNNGTFWNLFQNLIANDGEAHDQFGTSVSISGNYSLIGSPDSSVSNNSYQGKAYFFDLYSNPNPNPNSNSKSNSNSKIIISIIIILIILIGIILIILLIRKRKRNQYQYQYQYQKEKEKEEILMNNPLFSDDNDDKEF